MRKLVTRVKYFHLLRFSVFKTLGNLKTWIHMVQRLAYRSCFSQRLKSFWQFFAIFSKLSSLKKKDNSSFHRSQFLTVLWCANMIKSSKNWSDTYMCCCMTILVIRARRSRTLSLTYFVFWNATGFLLLKNS